MIEITKSNRQVRKRLGILALLAAIALFAAACGSDSEEVADDETTTESSAEDTTDDETADDETDDAATDNEADDAATDDEGDDAVVDGLPVELGEWYITLDGVAAGPSTFAINNVGENPHALAIAKGTAYEDLPLKDNGAVDTDALGADYLGGTDNVESGQSATFDIELEAGDYVFFCPIEFGPNSHAANGQVLSVTVS